MNLSYHLNFKSSKIKKNCILNNDEFKNRVNSTFLFRLHPKAKHFNYVFKINFEINDFLLQNLFLKMVCILCFICIQFHRKGYKGGVWGWRILRWTPWSLSEKLWKYERTHHLWINWGFGYHFQLRLGFG